MRDYRLNTYGPPAAIDRAAHVLHGVSALQAVEALGHRIMIDDIALQQFVDLANEHGKGLKSRFTHPGLSSDGLGRFLGRVVNFRVQGDKALGDLQLAESAALSPHGDLRSYIETRAAEDPTSFGMSIVFDGTRHWRLADGREVPVKEQPERPDDSLYEIPVVRMSKVHAVDVVDEPAANRDGLFSVFRGTTNEFAANTYMELDSMLPELGITSIDGLERLIGDFMKGESLPGMLEGYIRYLRDECGVSERKMHAFAASYLLHRRYRAASDERFVLSAAPAAESQFMESATMSGKDETIALQAEKPEAGEQSRNGEAAWLNSIQRTAAEMMIKGSGLPKPVQARLMRQQFGDPEAVETAISEARNELAELQESQVVNLTGPAPRGGKIGVQDPIDEAQGIVDWMFGVPDAKTPQFNMRDMAQLYVALTGDAEFHGLFDEERVMFSGANTSTLVNMAVDAMNKVVTLQLSNMMPYRWFEQLTKVAPHDGSTQDLNLITMGGISNLPDVDEGAAYTELDVDDVKETAAFVKRGGYVGITLEMIRKSNILQLQAVPEGLARAAIRTRSAAVSDIFTSNSGVGPTLAQDSTALFHSNHSNVQTTALGTNLDAWEAASIECFGHTEIQSGKALAVFPRFLLVPKNLYFQARENFQIGSGYPTGVNVWAQGNEMYSVPEIVLVPDWTDATDWAYIVDPKVYPVIYMSYAQLPGGGGHPPPELFSVQSPTSGLMFTNDTLPIKVRDWWTVGVAGWRGIGKRNVA